MGASMASGICQTDEVPLLETDGEIELYDRVGMTKFYIQNIKEPLILTISMSSAFKSS